MSKSILKKLCFIFLILSANQTQAKTLTQNELNKYSYCTGFYMGVYESQPHSSIGHEAKGAYAFFETAISNTGKQTERIQYKNGHYIGFRLWDSPENHDNPPKETGFCFDTYTNYIRDN